jgi:monoamine oxidase
MSNQEQKNTMIEFLRLSFQEYVNETESAHSRPLWEPDEFISGDWGPGTEFIGGAYTSYFPPNVLSRIDNWQAYRQVEKGPNVFWAGADYHAGFGNGYIEGAIRSGQYAADQIRRRLENRGKNDAVEESM